MDSTIGPMDACIKDTGRITRWKGKASSLGPTEEYTKVNTLTIRRKAKAFLHGKMVENIRENGRMVNSMESVYTLQLTAGQKRVNG